MKTIKIIAITAILTASQQLLAKSYAQLQLEAERAVERKYDDNEVIDSYVSGDKLLVDVFVQYDDGTKKKVIYNTSTKTCFMVD